MENQWVTVGDLIVVIPIVLAIIGATWKISRTLSLFETRIIELESDRYTLSAASENALRMALSNPTMVVHDPRDPSKIIQHGKAGGS